jgi:hypothetical protein
MKLTRDNMQGLLKRRTKEIKVGEYEIKIIEMTIPQQLEVESILQNKKSNSDLLIPVLKFCVVDDDNQPMLDDEMVKGLPAGTAATIFKQCIELNSITEKELENRAKNS